MTPDNVEVYTVDGIGQGANGDTLSYAGTTAFGVTVDLGAVTPTADGFASVAGIENVVGGSLGERRSQATAATTRSTAGPAATP